MGMVGRGPRPKWGMEMGIGGWEAEVIVCQAILSSSAQWTPPRYLVTTCTCLLGLYTIIWKAFVLISFPSQHHGHRVFVELLAIGFWFTGRYNPRYVPLLVIGLLYMCPTQKAHSFVEATWRTLALLDVWTFLFLPDCNRLEFIEATSSSLLEWKSVLQVQQTTSKQGNAAKKNLDFFPMSRFNCCSSAQKLGRKGKLSEGILIQLIPESNIPGKRAQSKIWVCFFHHFPALVLPSLSNILQKYSTQIISLVLGTFLVGSLCSSSNWLSIRTILETKVRPRERPFWVRPGRGIRRKLHYSYFFHFFSVVSFCYVSVLPLFWWSLIASVCVSVRARVCFVRLYWCVGLGISN